MSIANSVAKFWWILHNPTRRLDIRYFNASNLRHYVLSVHIVSKLGSRTGSHDPVKVVKFRSDWQTINIYFAASINYDVAYFTLLTPAPYDCFKEVQSGSGMYPSLFCLKIDDIVSHATEGVMVSVI